MFSNLVFLEQSTAATAGEPYELLLPLGLILILAKLFAILADKVHLPQVIGFLVAGLVIGLVTFIPNQPVFTAYTKEGLNFLGKIGVVLILFTAGLETDLHKIKAVGKAAMIITSLGVLFPLIFGCGIAYAFFPHADFYSNLFYGVVLTATSVSITVATLKELGQLDTKVGTAIVSAAIIDDVIGIILLSLVTTLAGGDSGVHYVDNKGWNIVIIILVMLSFFVLSILAGFLIKRFVNFLGRKYPHHIRIPIFSLAFCFLWAYIAEKFFNIADITGGYIAGLILSTVSGPTKKYIDHRAVTTANLIFTPVFFVMIALKMYEPGALDFSDVNFIFFGLCWVILGLLGKFVGAGFGAKICRFSWKDSAIVGVGMMARAEVVIVCAQRGMETFVKDASGNPVPLVSPMLMPYTLVLIILSSFVTPIFLKLLCKGRKEEGDSVKEVTDSSSSAK